MRNIHRIPEAIADLESQDVPNVKATAEKYDVTRKTLENRWKGKSISMEAHVSSNRQCLTNSQEKALLQIINKLTDRRIPPTTAIVKNLAEEIRGCAVNKNWTAAFVRRHKDEVKSLYLKSIDIKRVKGEYAAPYEVFYNLVCYFYCVTPTIRIFEPL
jgi:hypothetical protein